MTWSIVAHDPATGAFAVAVTTCAFAVGASCPFVRPGIGAVSTQAMTNRYLGPAVLEGLARGLSPKRAIESGLCGDDGKNLRQIHAIDRHGQHAVWTGGSCFDWAGGVSAPNVGVTGNTLAGPDVVEHTLARYLAGATEPMADRLIGALVAGQRAGGDARGRQSAALKLITTEDFPDIDLRVDDHPDPLDELARLLVIYRRDRAPGLKNAPSRATPSGVINLDVLDADRIALGLAPRPRRENALR
jgi:uncharacterized Ntn-hydrolase superfamily protein